MYRFYLQPKRASSGQTSSHYGGNGYEEEGCCYSPLTLVLIIFASLCCTPAGWIARRYYGQVCTVEPKLFARRKFSPISPYDYIEHMVAFAVLVEIYSTEHFCNTKAAGLGEIFLSSKNFQLYSILLPWKAHTLLCINLTISVSIDSKSTSYAGRDTESSAGVCRWDHRGVYYNRSSDCCTGAILHRKDRITNRYTMNMTATLYTAHYNEYCPP